jgi:hypothetical protein
LQNRARSGLCSPQFVHAGIGRVYADARKLEIAAESRAV